MLCVLLVGWDQIASVFGWRRTLPRSETYSEACPACYGTSLCKQLSAIQLAPLLEHLLKFGTRFDVIKAYFASSSMEQQVVLKRLAFQSELQEFDELICRRMDLPGKSCRRGYNQGDVAERLASQLVSNRSLFLQMAGGTPSLPQCVSDRLWHSIHSIYDSDRDGQLSGTEASVLMTTLAINSEPILLQVLVYAGFVVVLINKNLCTKACTPLLEKVDDVAGASLNTKLNHLQKHTLWQSQKRLLLCVMCVREDLISTCEIIAREFRHKPNVCQNYHLKVPGDPNFYFKL